MGQSQDTYCTLWYQESQLVQGLAYELIELHLLWLGPANINTCVFYHIYFLWIETASKYINISKIYKFKTFNMHDAKADSKMSITISGLQNPNSKVRLHSMIQFNRMSIKMSRLQNQTPKQTPKLDSKVRLHSTPKSDSTPLQDSTPWFNSINYTEPLSATKFTLIWKLSNPSWQQAISGGPPLPVIKTYAFDVMISN